MPRNENRRPLREIYRREKSRLERLFKTEIWKASNLRDNRRKSAGFQFLRIIAISISGLKESHIASRAAALCFSSLLGLGPLLAVAVTLSGYLLERTESDLPLRTIERAITFVAPQITISEDPDQDEERPEEYDEQLSVEMREINPELAAFLDDFIARAQSGTIGVAGTLLIILVAIQLLTTVENAFNTVWGVKRGRGMFQRVVFYWTIISLGAVLGFAALGLFSLSLTAVFQNLPLGEHFLAFVQWLTPLFSLLVLILLLTAFYRFMPNTHVAWRPALCGATIVALLLLANNALTFLYVQRVVTTYTIYGSVGILPVMMLGLFVFWLIVLFGTQIIYAIQNVNYLSNREAWKGISHNARELLSLLLLVLICRRFQRCEQPLSTEELTSLVGAPSQIVNESLSRLADLGYVASIPEAETGIARLTRHQPARPLERITLDRFRKDFADYGNSEAVPILDDLDPIVQRYREETLRKTALPTGSKPLSELLEPEHGVSRKRPGSDSKNR